MNCDEGLPKSRRLRKRAEFLRVQEHGHKISSPLFLALALRNPSGSTRIGLTASRAVGHAVARNRARRRLRELFRRNQHGLPRGLDLVIIARSSASSADWLSLERAFLKLSEELKKVFR